jgi:hypothetical protein
MKQIFAIALIAISSISAFAQSSHIKQSTPFENVLLSMKADSISLFMNSFSKKVIHGKKDEKLWISRLNEGKEKFEKRFGTFQLSDFSYKYDSKESKLIIFFKNEEQIGMRVIKEGRNWKLDEK